MATLLLIRFDEQTADVPPSDDVGSLLDLLDAGAIATTVVDGWAGNARHMASTAGNVGTRLQAVDVVPGSTLATRDVTVDAILRWDFDGQVALSATTGFTVGTVCTRGIGPAASAGVENSAYALELRIVSAAQRIGEVRLSWHDSAGGSHPQLGGQFQLPAANANGFLMLTAVRKWIAPTQVQLRYYLGDQLLAEHITADGDVGGGATGTFNVGGVDTLFGTSSYFVGDVDELRVRDTAASPEEIAATYKRLSYWQPLGYAMVQQLIPPDLPISDDPGSKIQRVLRAIGHGMGYEMAQTDNMLNLMPDRAYGAVLRRWEAITQQASRPGDSIEVRRRRVVGRWSQHLGASSPGVRAAVAGQLQVAPSQLQTLAFSQDIVEDFSAAPNPSRWWIPNTGAVTWTGASDKSLRFQRAAGAFPLRTLGENLAPVALLSVQGDGQQAHLIANLIENTAMPDNGEAGIVLADWLANTAITFGLRSVATGQRSITIELSFAGKVQAFGVLAGIGSANALPAGPIALHAYHIAGSSSPPSSTYRFECSTAPWGSAAIVGLTITFDTTLTGVTLPQPKFAWAGLYARSLNGTGVATAAALDVKFQAPILRSPKGDRPFLWYVYRDPALPGTSDIIGAQATATRLGQAHTKNGIITTKQAVCDSTTSLTDNTPLGAL